MTPLGNELGEWITLRGENYSNDPAGKQYSVGREIFCWNVDGNFDGDTIVVLEVLIDFAGDRRLCRGRSFRGLLAEDNPVISW